MADYSGRIQSTNEHVSQLTSARFVWVDGSVTTPVTVVPNTKGCRLLRVMLNTNGATLKLRSGSRVIANIALDAPEATFNYGVYCPDGLIYEAGGALDATIVFAL